MLGKSFNQKKEQNKPSQPTRNRLTALYAPPTIRDIRVLLAEAEKARGLLCELPIQIGTGTFLLSCQSDHLSKEPCWTLYEGDGAKQVWSYLTDNLEMIENIVSMSVMKGSPAPAPASSAAMPGPQAAATVAAPAAQSLPPDKPYDPYSGPAMQPAAQPNPMPAADPSAAWPGVWNQGQPATNQTAWQQAQPAAYQQQPQDIPWSGNTWQQPQQTIAAPPAADQPYDPYSNWQSAPAAPAAMFATAAPPASPADLAGFAARLDGKKNMTMAQLSMDPTLPPVCINAVLKLQEMVLTGHFNEKVAFQALKLAVLNNGVLDEGVLAKAKASAALDPDELARHAARLLQQAQLLSERDALLVEKNMAQHNDSFLASIRASGKVDKVVLEAAQDCYPFVADGRLRHDQAMIALHYCARSRCKFKDALSELSIHVD